MPTSAATALGGKSLSQHSQLGRNSSMSSPLLPCVVLSRDHFRRYRLASGGTPASVSSAANTNSRNRQGDQRRNRARHPLHEGYTVFQHRADRRVAHALRQQARAAHTGRAAHRAGRAFFCRDARRYSPRWQLGLLRVRHRSHPNARLEVSGIRKAIMRSLGTKPAIMPIIGLCRHPFRRAGSGRLRLTDIGIIIGIR